MSERKTPSQPVSDKKLAANRANARRSTGPKNSGSTRYNAAKHGLLAEGVTELDDAAEYVACRVKLQDELNVTGIVEAAPAHRIALAIMRLRRAVQLEAEHITGRLNPPITEHYSHDEALDLLAIKLAGTTVVLDPGLPARLSVADIESLHIFQRYETMTENRLYRALNQLERLQRIRRGEAVPAPAAVDVNVHQSTGNVASFGNSDAERAN